MNVSPTRPIGVFDSGLGGLTVVKALQKKLPNEDILYVGDTARVPYGTKSPDTIRRYALQIAFFLLQKKVKAIVVACNSVSAVALRDLSQLPVPVVGVINPGARAAARQTKNKGIGVIGTKATVSSHAYREAIKKESARLRVTEIACPLFVPLVEEGWAESVVTEKVAQTYLKPLRSSSIDTLVLGCTHYPLLKKVIRKTVGPQVTLIDSADETAEDVAALLKRAGLLKLRGRGQSTYFVTDHPESFKKHGQKFLGTRMPTAKKVAFDNL